METREIRIELIDAPLAAPRWGLDGPALQELAESIARVGLLQPVVVVPNDDRYRLVAGNRRLHACRDLLGWDTISALVYNHLPEEMAATAVENLQRVDLDAVEEALMFASIIQDRGITQEHLAQLIGKSRSYVAKRMMLLDLDEATLQAIVKGTISWTHALELKRVDDPERRTYFRDLTEAHGVNVRILRNWVDEDLARPAEERAQEPAWDGEVVLQPVSYEKLTCMLCDRTEDEVILTFVPMCQRDKLELQKLLAPGQLPRVPG